MTWAVSFNRKVIFTLYYFHCIFNFLSIKVILVIRIIVDEQVEQHEDLKIRFNEGAKERKELYNKIQELKG